jgi:hypothetical protein
MSEKSDVIDKNFGVVIAFWLPGFLLLWGLTYSFPGLATLLPKSTEGEAPTIGGFLYVTLASLAIGLIVSAVRWMIIDPFLHHAIGPAEPQPDFGKLRDKDAFVAFQGAVENHYRFYQYYSNTLVSVLAAVITYLVRGRETISWLVWLSLAITCISLFLGSRDCLKKYYSKAE